MEKFLLYNDDLAFVDQLTNDEAGQLFKVICNYTKYGIEPLDRSTQLLFANIKSHLDADNQKSIVLKQKRIEAGKQGGRPTQKTPKTKHETKPLALPVEQYSFVDQFIDGSNPQVAYQISKNPNYKAEQCLEVDKLVKDGYTMETIQTVLAYIKQDEFWSKQILSIAKLRRKDKDGIPYMVRMINQVKNYKPRVLDLDSM